MGTSRIEWTESTWNPVTGCTKISSGCLNCYAERMANRLQAMGQSNYQNGFRVTCHSHALSLPYQWKKPQNIFVNSMGDLFHEAVPFDFIEDVFSVMHTASWHQFQVLTKRSERLAHESHRLQWTENIWMGVTVEAADYLYRIEHLRHSGARLKFLSLEPLIGPLGSLDLNGIDWVIVGGESGPHSRPMCEDWVLEIKVQCEHFGVPFFFKQWGGVQKKKAGRLLGGHTWDARPQATIAK